MTDDEREIEVDGHEISVSNTDKVLFGEAGITKGDLIDYYVRIAETMLPHVRERPISMERWPDGLDGESFYQKRVPDYFPDWIERATLKTSDGDEITQVVIDDAPTLAYLANQACITPHVWLSRTDRIERPDRMVFDFDPSGDATFADVTFGARKVRDALEGHGIPARVMTTGSRGLHVVVRLERRHTFEDVRAFARKIADDVTEASPERLTVEQRKAKRGDRVFVDTLRNAHGQTSVAPYAVRARPGAPVATPIDWDELSDENFGPRRWTIENIFRRLGQRDDPWAKAMKAVRLPG